MKNLPIQCKIQIAEFDCCEINIIKQVYCNISTWYITVIISPFSLISPTELSVFTLSSPEMSVLIFPSVMTDNSVEEIVFSFILRDKVSHWLMNLHCILYIENLSSELKGPSLC